MRADPSCQMPSAAPGLGRHYCGPEGVSLWQLGRAGLFPRSGLPNWKQFENRMVLPVFLGRVGIWQLCRIWRLQPGDEILMPAYNCGTEVDPFLVWGCKVVFYRVDEKARIDFSDLARRKTVRTKVLHIIHYFGWPQDLSQAAPWCHEEKIRLVEDCALALFSSGPAGPLGRQGDAAIFSPAKTLPVPGGGFLTLAEDAAPPARLLDPPLRMCRPRILAMLKRDWQHKLQAIGLYSTAHAIKRRFQPARWTGGNPDAHPDMPADYYFDKRLMDLGMSRLSLNLMRAVDCHEVVERRRRNYLYMDKSLKLGPGDRPLFDSMPDGVCPLSFPLVVKDRPEWFEFLAGKGIVSQTWWAGEHRACSWAEFPEAEYLKRSVLCLPVDQGLDPAQKEFIAGAVNQHSQAR
jgi:dTDP-4-amino-4,6-dideoxygalactose transaminase